MAVARNPATHCRNPASAKAEVDGISTASERPMAVIVRAKRRDALRAGIISSFFSIQEKAVMAEAS